MKILVGDDDPIMIHLLHSGLRARGWEVSIAQDAMQVVMFATRTQPDAIILDINMPGGTGIGALKRLKASTTLRTIPVLVVSGSKDPAMPQTVRELGADQFLAKPVDLDAIHDALSRMISGPPAPR